MNAPGSVDIVRQCTSVKLVIRDGEGVQLASISWDTPEEAMELVHMLVDAINDAMAHRNEHPGGCPKHGLVH